MYKGEREGRGRGEGEGGEQSNNRTRERRRGKTARIPSIDCPVAHLRIFASSTPSMDPRIDLLPLTPPPPLARPTPIAFPHSHPHPHSHSTSASSTTVGSLPFPSPPSPLIAAAKMIFHPEGTQPESPKNKRDHHHHHHKPPFFLLLNPCLFLITTFPLPHLSNPPFLLFDASGERSRGHSPAHRNAFGSDPE